MSTMKCTDLSVPFDSFGMCTHTCVTCFSCSCCHGDRIFILYFVKVVSYFG